VRAIRGNLVAAFSTGRILLYSLSSRSLLAEICAHSRWINALAKHPTEPVFASVSDDTFLNIWKIPQGNGREVALLHSSVLTDKMGYGVTFMASGDLAVLSYDHEALTVFRAK
jgi:WD40 repeat protein